MRLTTVILGVVLCGFSMASISEESTHPVCNRCGQASVVADTTAIRNATVRLRQSFAERLGVGEVAECSLIMEAGFGEGFSAVGGSCKVAIAGKTTDWMICSDNGVGNFAAVTGARWWQDPRTYLGGFLESNCVGG